MRGRAHGMYGVDMRAALFAIVLAASPSHADSFVEAGGGIFAPLASDDWQRRAAGSLKAFLRGGMDGPASWMGAVDASNVETRSFDYMYRFRAMAGRRWTSRRDRAVIVGRLLGGLEIIHTRTTITAPSFAGTGTTTSPGVSVEAAIGAWQSFGEIEVGIEAALPLAIHRTDGGNDDPDRVGIEHVSVDFDLLVGVRYMIR